jgi:hypothetical protein
LTFAFLQTSGNFNIFSGKNQEKYVSHKAEYRRKNDGKLGPRQKTKVAKPEDLRYASRGGPYFVPINNPPHRRRVNIGTSQGRQDAAAISKKRCFTSSGFSLK